MNHDNDRSSSGVAFEPLLTYRKAADIYGIPYWKIQRAAKLGFIETVRFFNSRQYVRGSEIERALVGKAVRNGGGR